MKNIKFESIVKLKKNDISRIKFDFSKEIRLILFNHLDSINENVKEYFKALQNLQLYKGRVERIVIN